MHLFGPKTLLILAALFALMPLSAAADQSDGRLSAMTGREIMERLNAREEGQEATREFTLELTGRNGIVRTQKTVNFRKYYGEDSRSILFYTEPTNIRGTGFLTFNHAAPEIADDRWLYLPALRRVRRISSSDRGDYFLGTDFTYEDITQEQKVTLADYSFEARGTERVNGVDTLVVEGVPVSDTIAAELGYSRVVWRVDPQIWMSRKGDYYDIGGNHLKTIHLERVEVISGITTAMQVHVENHRTGHSTRLTFTKVDYESPIDDALFSQTRLRRGL